MRKFAIHPISVIIWAWLFAFHGILLAINYAFAIVIHEMGHYMMAKRLGYKLSRFGFSPFGVELSYFDQHFDYREELKIAFAGPIANLISAFLVCGVWWIFPTTYFVSSSFVSVSCVLALVNLLPAYPLDGGRIFVDIFSYHFDERQAVKITFILNMVFSSFFAIAFVVCMFYNFNPTLIAFAVFLLAGLLEFRWKTKFDKINVFTKQTKNFVKPTFIYVDTSVTTGQMLAKLQTAKTTIFCVVLASEKVVFVDEKMLINLSVKYGINTKLKNIFQK